VNGFEATDALGHTDNMADVVHALNFSNQMEYLLYTVCDFRCSKGSNIIFRDTHTKTKQTCKQNNTQLENKIKTNKKYCNSHTL